MDISIVVCEQCNFIFQNPQITEEALHCHYQTNSSGSVYSLQGDDTRTSKLLDERGKLIEEIIVSNSIRSICDIGGGKGLLLSSLAFDAAIEKYLVEPSSAIDLCSDSNVRKIQTFYEHLDPLESQFDLLLCISALEHFRNPTLALRKFHSLITNDGFLLIEVPDSLNPHGTFSEFYSYEHINHFTIQSLQNFLFKTGFYIVRVDKSKTAPNIRILARKSDPEVVYDQCFIHFEQYKRKKAELRIRLQRKLNSILKSDQIPDFAIYGAGDHTRFLLESFDLLKHVSVFIDSDPSKRGTRFLDRAVIGPENIVSENIKNILISSHDFEEEIFQSLCQMSEHGIRIIRLYG